MRYPRLTFLLIAFSAAAAVAGEKESGAAVTVPYGDPNSVPRLPVPSPFPRAVLAPEVSPNVRCNNREVCASGRGVTQSETALAISGDAVVCGYNDFRANDCPGEGYQWAGWAYSLDAGSSFTNGGRLPGNLWRGDPWLASGVDGSVYYANIWNNLQGLAVTRGTVTKDGIQWSDPTVVSMGGPFDKEAMTVDRNSGAIYLTYTRLGNNISLFRSTDGAASFEGPFVVRPASGTQGSFPAVGPNGEVYVTWNIGWPSQTGIGFAKSTDGGATFGSAQTVGRICNFQIPGLNRANPAFPQMAVDTSGGPNNGNIYIVWHTACESGNGDAVMIRSTDGGETWGDPLVINDDDTTTLQFYPTISVDDLGRVNVFFYDRRENPETTVTNVYFAQSTDGGATFNANIKVTDVASTWQTSGDTPNYGDYINSVSVGTKACVAFADSRDGDPDAYFACVDIPK